ncbi:MAG: endonuclease [Myxococcales bacterium]|nr:endonuclease [Myxococcales bacterium]
MSHGEIARSVMYMSVTYDLQAYALRHLHVLRMWAGSDPPTRFEHAYNDFVQEVTGAEFGRGVRNPFVDRPALVEE